MKDKLISELIKRYKLLYCWLLLLIPNDVVYDCKMCRSIIILWQMFADNTLHTHGADDGEFRKSY